MQAKSHDPLQKNDQAFSRLLPDAILFLLSEKSTYELSTTNIISDLDGNYFRKNSFIFEATNSICSSFNSGKIGSDKQD